MYTYVDQINNVYETSENSYEIVVFRWSIKFLNKKPTTTTTTTILKISRAVEENKFINN